MLFLSLLHIISFSINNQINRKLFSCSVWVLFLFQFIVLTYQGICLDCTIRGHCRWCSSKVQRDWLQMNLGRSDVHIWLKIRFVENENRQNDRRGTPTSMNKRMARHCEIVEHVDAPCASESSTHYEYLWFRRRNPVSRTRRKNNS